MIKREFTFEIKEIVQKSNPKNGRIVDEIQTIKGVAFIRNNGEIDIVVDDDKQPSGMFFSNRQLLYKAYQ